MPYIKKENRKKFAEPINTLVTDLTRNDTNIVPGDVNYVISSLIWKLWDRNPSYRQGNNLIGALHCVITEFERRKLAPYEDKKIVENGDLL